VLPDELPSQISSGAPEPLGGRSGTLELNVSAPSPSVIALRGLASHQMQVRTCVLMLVSECGVWCLESAG